MDNASLINSLKVPDWWQRTHPENPSIDENIVFITNKGDIFRKIEGMYGRHTWLILANKNKACGWYYTGSPFVSELVNGVRKILTHDGKRVDTHPLMDNLQAYNIHNLTYFLCPSEVYMDGYEEIDLYLKTNDNMPTMTGYMYPLYKNLDNDWINPKDLGQVGWENWGESISLIHLPIYNPTSYNDLSTIHCPHPQSFSVQIDSGVPEETEEYRNDPFDNLWYTKQEFVYYYGDTLFWDMLSLEKVSQRFMLETMIQRNKGILSTKNVNYLLDKMIETFM